MPRRLTFYQTAPRQDEEVEGLVRHIEVVLRVADTTERILLAQHFEQCRQLRFVPLGNLVGAVVGDLIGGRRQVIAVNL